MLHLSVLIFQLWLKTGVESENAYVFHTSLVIKPLAAAMNKLAGVLALATASAETFVQDGALSLSWKDCGDVSTKGTVSSLSPTSLTLGQNTKVIGTGSVTEDVSGGQIVFGVKASIISQSFPGDLCSPKTLTLPLGVGTVTYDGMKCPLAAGAVSVPVDILLSSALPSRIPFLKGARHHICCGSPVLLLP